MENDQTNSEMADTQSSQHPLKVLSSSLVLVVSTSTKESLVPFAKLSDSFIKPARYSGIQIGGIQGRVVSLKSASVNMCPLPISSSMTLLMKLRLKLYVKAPLTHLSDFIVCRYRDSIERLQS